MPAPDPPLAARPWFARGGVLIFSLAVAVMLTSIASIRWWHPYCDRPDDGPGYFAGGFPLPYSEFSGASSMTFVTNWVAYATDIACFALLVWPLARWAARRVPAGVSASAGVLAAIPALLLLYGTWSATIMSAWAIDPTDAYSAFRPYVLMQHSGHRACDAYRSALFTQHRPRLYNRA